MFKVIDSGKEATAKSYGFKEGLGWDNCAFDKYYQACLYADNWLGDYTVCTRVFNSLITRLTQFSKFSFRFNFIIKGSCA